MDSEVELLFTVQDLIAAEGVLRKAADLPSRLGRDRPRIRTHGKGGKPAPAHRHPWGVEFRQVLIGQSPCRRGGAARPAGGEYETAGTSQICARAFRHRTLRKRREITVSANENVPRGTVKRLEVGLPSSILRSVEFLDLPGSANVLFSAGHHNPVSYGIDAAIWTTAATQAWRESERSHWLQLPQAIRSRGLLAVTFCDMIKGESDLKRLHARLEASAKPYFREICFVAAAGEDAAATAPSNTFLFRQIQSLAQEFSTARLSKATAIARRMAKNTLGKLGS